MIIVNGNIINLHHVCPPIPSRGYDWQATLDDNEDEGCPVGFGATPDEAVQDLLEQLEA
jgi:hypothetical protein